MKITSLWLVEDMRSRKLLGAFANEERAKDFANDVELPSSKHYVEIWKHSFVEVDLTP